MEGYVGAGEEGIAVASGSVRMYVPSSFDVNRDVR
jgi:hypothetical protein